MLNFMLIVYITVNTHSSFLSENSLVIVLFSDKDRNCWSYIIFPYFFFNQNMYCGSSKESSN